MQQVILIAVGLIAGVLGGLLGIGGSVVMIPAMVLLFDVPGQPPRQHLYQGAAMMVNLFVVLPAALQHHRAGATLWPVVRVMVASGGVAVLAGVLLSSGPWFREENEAYLTALFGLFMLYAAAYNARRMMSRRRLAEIDQHASRSLSRPRVAMSVGLPMGLAAGLLGIGGGALAVPLQQVFLRIPLRRAIANSATTIVVVSFIGATLKNCANARMGIPFRDAVSLAVWLVPSAIVGGFIGGRLTHVLPRKALRLAVIVLMCYAGIRLVLKASASSDFFA